MKNSFETNDQEYSRNSSSSSSSAGDLAKYESIRTSLLTSTPKESSLEELKLRVEKAAEKGKIFTIYEGFPEIRHELVKRGWIEKCAPPFRDNVHSLPDEIIHGLRRRGNIYETVALSKIAARFTANFIWQPNSDNLKPNERLKPYRNGIQRSSDLNFTTKLGLINCIDNSYWHTGVSMSDIRTPRHYRILTSEEHLDFLRVYRSSYCCSLLKFIIDTNPVEIFSKNGDLRINTIEFAIDRIRQEIALHAVSDINTSSEKNPFGDQYKNESEWTMFFSSVNMLLEKVIKIKVLSSDIENKLRTTCRELIDKCKKFWPLILSEGYNNLWILKPGSSSRGRGICIKNKFHDIINYVNRRPVLQYIVQKYIEQPLLIYKTKFDIRLHILLTIINDRFNIWIYKDCYLRFCSYEYDLNNLAESIHLTNRSVQEKYRNGPRNPLLPECNMWSLKDFIIYLKSIKKGDIWSNKIFPCMKKNIIAIVMASLEETDFIENTFDIYGCDFMIDQYFEPILIEINSSPSLTRSTIVTAKICPAVLKDIIKVVVDWSNNSNANTGNFELILSFDFQSELYYLEYNKEFDVIGRSVKSITTTKSKYSTKPIDNDILDVPVPYYLKNYRKKTNPE